MTEHENAPDVLPVPLILEAATTPDVLTLTFTLNTRAPSGNLLADEMTFERQDLTGILTAEHPTPRALLVLFKEGTEAARFFLGAPLADLAPPLLEALPALPRVHPSRLADHLRTAGLTLIFPVLGVPDCPSLFPTEAEAKHAGDALELRLRTAEKLFSGDTGQELTPEEQEAGADLLELLGAALEYAREPDRDPPDRMN